MTQEQTHTARTPLPALSDADRAAALAKAMDVRHARVAAREDYAAGRRGFADLVTAGAVDKDVALKGVRVRDLLTWVPGAGPKRAGEWMETVGVAPGRRIGGLGPRQREALVELVAEHTARRTGQGLPAGVGL